MTVVYIYDLSDPRTGHVRYVGKSVNPKERLATHIREARGGSVLHSRRWIDGLLKAGMRPVLSVLEETSKQDADAAERFWIASLRLMGAELTNLTHGGDGQSPGYMPTLEVRQKIGNALRGRKRSDETKARLKAALNAPEVRAARRARMLREMADPQKRAKAQYGRTGQPMSEEAKAKIAAKWTPERKARHAAEKSALPFDDRWRAQLAEAIKARWDKYRAQKAGECSQSA